MGIFGNELFKLNPSQELLKKCNSYRQVYKKSSKLLKEVIMIYVSEMQVTHQRLSSYNININVSPDEFNEHFVNIAQSLVNQFGNIPIIFQNLL